jgi:SAM-dependent methyltransferase
VNSANVPAGAPASAAPVAAAPSGSAFPSPFARPDLYDVLFADFDSDLPFYLELGRNAGGAVLDVGCGTGRLLLPLLESGVDVEGLDLSVPMLERLREKARARSLEPRLHHAAMASFALPRRFPLVMIPFNAFVHNLTAEEQIATLACCRHHLEPGGLLAFDVFTPTPVMLAHPTGGRVLELQVEHPTTGLAVRLWDARRFDVLAQTQHSHIEIEELDAAGAVVATHRSAVVVRWIYPAEMELLLRLAGFARWQLWGGFDRGPRATDSGLMVVEAWRD